MIIIRLINTIAYLASLLLMARAILSWFGQNPYSPAYKYYVMTIKLTEPFVEPVRRFLSGFNTGMFDFSILVTLLGINILQKVLIRLLILLFF